MRSASSTHAPAVSTVYRYARGLDGIPRHSVLVPSSPPTHWDHVIGCFAHRFLHSFGYSQDAINIFHDAYAAAHNDEEFVDLICTHQPSAAVEEVQYIYELMLCGDDDVVEA